MSHIRRQKGQLLVNVYSSFKPFADGLTGEGVSQIIQPEFLEAFWRTLGVSLVNDAKRLNSWDSTAILKPRLCLYEIYTHRLAW